jgi:hypothetical protein
MSLLDDLQGVERRIVERMRELKPLVDEYQQLEEAARRRGIDPGAVAEEVAPRRRAARSRGARASSRTTGSRFGRGRGSGGGRGTGRRAPSGTRQTQLLELIKDQPGITVREAGERLGVDSTSLYRVVHRLEQEGVVKKEGTQLQPSEASGPS